MRSTRTSTKRRDRKRSTSIHRNIERDAGRTTHRPPQPKTDRALRRDLRTLAKFIDVYCRHRHKRVARDPVRLKMHDVQALYGKPLRLCTLCRKLLAQALVKRTSCPYDPKPDCKKCPTHCYAPKYRAAIREVMKYSGRRLVLSGRLDYLFQLLG